MRSRLFHPLSHLSPPHSLRTAGLRQQAALQAPLAVGSTRAGLLNVQRQFSRIFVVRPELSDRLERPLQRLQLAQSYTSDNLTKHLGQYGCVSQRFDHLQSDIGLSLGIAFCILTALGLIIESFTETPDCLEPIQYPVLDDPSASFRVLALFPGSWYKSLTCRLEVVPFSADFRYTAISYTWGDTAKLKQVKVNDNKAGIPQSVLQLLKYFRHPTEVRYLWIDYVCINQSEKPENVAEKNAQVAQMPDIYQNARRVIIWLGVHEYHDPYIQRARSLVFDDSFRHTLLMSASEEARKYEREREKKQESLEFRRHESERRRRDQREGQRQYENERLEGYETERYRRLKGEKAWRHGRRYDNEGLEWYEAERYRKYGARYGRPRFDEYEITATQAEDKTKSVDEIWRIVDKQVDANLRRQREAVLASENFVYDLIHEEYWKRSWIIQETAMAKDNLMVCYGSESVPWNEFVRWIRIYQDNHPKDMSIIPILKLDDLRQSQGKAGVILSLSYLLDHFKDAFSSNVHDKIYAFRGLAHDCVGDAIAVDYAKPLPKLYEDLIYFYWNKSSLSPKQRSIELMHHSAMIRQLLTRQSAQRLKAGMPRTVELEDMIIYAIEAIFNALRRRLTKSQDVRPREWYWMPSDREDISVWLPNLHSSERPQIMSVRGIVLGQVEQSRPAYLASTLWDEADEQVPQIRQRLISLSQHSDQFRMSRNYPSGSLDPRAVPSTPQICTLTNGMVSVVPASTRQGDLVCQFWNSKAFAVVRLVKTPFLVPGKKRPPHYELVGQAAVIKNDGTDVEISLELGGELFGTVNRRAVDVPVNLAELTHLSLDTVMLPGT